MKKLSFIFRPRKRNRSENKGFVCELEKIEQLTRSHTLAAILSCSSVILILPLIMYRSFLFYPDAVSYYVFERGWHLFYDELMRGDRQYDERFCAAEVTAVSSSYRYEGGRLRMLQ